MKENILVAVGSSTLAISLIIFSSQGLSAEDPDDRYRALFHQLDSDGSRSLDSGEAGAAGLSADSFWRLDSNGDRVVTEREFMVLSDDAPRQVSDRPGQATSEEERGRSAEPEIEVRPVVPASIGGIDYHFR